MLRFKEPNKAWGIANIQVFPQFSCQLGEDSTPAVGMCDIQGRWDGVQLLFTPRAQKPL